MKSIWRGTLNPRSIVLNFASARYDCNACRAQRIEVLISAQIFVLIACVAVDQEKGRESRIASSSPGSIRPEADIQQSSIAFTTTHWSVVLEAQGQSSAAHEALEKLCRIYWRPVFNFVRQRGIRREEAEDLTQGFFVLLLERRDFASVRREKGRLRSYLLTAVKNYLADEYRRATAIKRGKGERFISLEELHANEWTHVEPADPLTAELIYERQWAAAVLERVLKMLGDEYANAGNAALFDSLTQLLPDEPGAPSQADIAARFGMTRNAVTQAFHRFRRRYQSLLREEIAHTVATVGDIDDELRYLIAVVRA